MLLQATAYCILHAAFCILLYGTYSILLYGTSSVAEHAHLFCEKGINIKFLLIVPVQVENGRGPPALRALRGAHAVSLQLHRITPEEVIQADVDVRILVHTVLRRIEGRQAT